jgi:hypothetical protein
MWRMHKLVYKSAFNERLWLSNCVFFFLSNRRLASFDLNLSLWTTLLDNASYASYSVMAVNVQCNAIAIGNISGSLLLLFLESGATTSLYFLSRFSLV